MLPEGAWNATRIRVKICGNRHRGDGAVATAAGADAVGFIVGATYVSEDAISPAEARALNASLPPFVSGVLVTHLQTTAEILELYGRIQPSAIQLHNTISPRVIHDLRDTLGAVKLIKAIHVVDDTALGEALLFSSHVDAILLDSRTPDRIGGTGVTHDWTISREIVRHCPIPVVLAGGLTPENVAEAIAAVRPYGVDVNSGVDGKDGHKEASKVAQFIQRASASAGKTPGQA